MEVYNFDIPLSVKLFLNEYPAVRDSYMIYARLILDRKSAVVSLKTRVAADDFDFENECLFPTKKYNIVKNNQLRAKKEKIIGTYLQLVEAKKTVTAKIVRDAYKGKAPKTGSTSLVDCFDNFIKALKKNKEMSDGTIKIFNNTNNKMLSFLAETEQSAISIHDLNKKFVVEFEEWLLTAPTKKDKTGKPIARSTSKLYIKKFKSVIKPLIEKEVLQRDPFLGFKSKPFKHTTPVLLTYEEIEILKYHDLGGNESLQQVRDCFIFCIYTGLRYGDARDLRSHQIKKDRKGVHWITLYQGQEKTEEPLEVPMQAEAVRIYNKYEEFRRITGKVLPLPSNQKYNTYLKVIFDICGFKVKANSHHARHLFGTNTLEEGVDLLTTSRLMGHASTRSTERYGQTRRSKKAEAIKLLDARHQMAEKIAV